MPLLPATSLPSSYHDMEDQNVSRDPTDVLAEAELQWIYTEEELLQTPSILDGMKAEEEKQVRSRGTNFITQVGIMLKLSQITLCTASIFFNRFLMRHSLVKKEGQKYLHHFQIAATALFLATKVEEHTRKLKDLVVACCRVAQKNPNLLVDEQTKDYWLWRDTIFFNEEFLLERLCFDLTVESPYKVLYDFLRYFGLHHNKKLRDVAWAFINDSNMTQLCLLFTSRTVAATALYYAAKSTEVELPRDDNDRPWWEIQNIKLREVKIAMNYMVDFYENSPLKPGQTSSQYSGFKTPVPELEEQMDTQPSASRSSFPETSNNGEHNIKREREDAGKGDASDSRRTNGFSRAPVSRVPPQVRSGEPPAKKIKAEDDDTTMKDEEGSEEGELEE